MLAFLFLVISASVLVHAGDNKPSPPPPAPKPCDSGPCKNYGTCTNINHNSDFSCNCPSQWSGKTCEDNACANKPCNNGATCDRVSNTYECRCTDQFEGRTCDNDIDECEILDVCNGKNQACVNSYGSYSCVCKKGYYNQNDLDNSGSEQAKELNCTDCKVDFGENCDHCLARGCIQCGQGYVLNNASECIDQDECAELNPCHESTTCHNTIGGYQCGNCSAGYEGDGHSCTDVNECELGFCSPLVTCNNTDGSYDCGKCPPGYAGDGTFCVEIDECQDLVKAGCSSEGSVCVNTNGSYICYCAEGFHNIAANSSLDKPAVVCKDNDECATGPCHPLAECINTPGSFFCGKCPDGFDGDGFMCLDIDECLIGGCSDLVECNNTIGGFSCSPCPKGFAGDGSWCKDCRKDVTGINYDGFISETMQGIPCQIWNATSPHASKYRDLEANFCRNPVKQNGYVSEWRPWCYTVDPKVEWQFCSIPMCDIDMRANCPYGKIYEPADKDGGRDSSKEYKCFGAGKAPNEAVFLPFE